MCNHEAHMQFPTLFVTAKFAFWVFQFQLNKWPFLDRCVEKFRFLASKKWDSTITTHHISKRWWSLWSFQFSGWWFLIFFFYRNTFEKKIYLSQRQRQRRKVSGNISWVLGRRVMRRKLEPMSPFGGAHPQLQTDRNLGPLFRPQ